MTTSDQTDDLNHPVIRDIIHRADELTASDRIVLLKGLSTVVARDVTHREFSAIIEELRLKGERFYEATTHPGQGRQSRQVIGERDIEGR